jgi:hypothetical protein
METKGTDGTGGQGTPSLTDVTKQNNTVDLGGLDITGLGTEKFDSPEDAEAKKKADEAAAEAKRLADEEEAKKTAGQTDSKESFFEFENKQFKLDENGNALNEDGTIFKSKEELDAINAGNTNGSDDTVLPLIEEIIQLNGIQILDDKGQPKVYADTIQGVIEYSKDVAKFEAENSQKEFFNRLPQVKEFAQHLINGGKEEDFYKAKTASWKNYTLDTANEAQLIEVITQDLIAKGQTPDEAADIVTLYKDSNRLEEKGKAAVESRRKAEEVSNAQKAEKEKQESLATQAKIEQYWKGIETTIKTGKLQNIVIPEADKNAFFNYMSVAVDKNGNSQYDLDEMMSKPEDDLQYKYLRFKKFDLSKLVKNATGTSQARSLRERIEKEKSGTNNGGGETTKETVSPNDVNISFESVFGK